MMHDREKSDPAIVAVKPTNKARQPSCRANCSEPNAAEPVEPRAGTEGNANRQSTHRTQSRGDVSQAPGRIRQRQCRRHPRWEPYAGKPHVRICAGGAR